jgi:hypothetical protein
VSISGEAPVVPGDGGDADGVQEDWASSLAWPASSISSSVEEETRLETAATSGVVDVLVPLRV